MNIAISGAARQVPVRFDKVRKYFGSVSVLEDFDLEIAHDHQSDFYQWFHFRLLGAKGRTVELRILNAAGSAYPLGWPGYQAALDANGKVYEAYIYPGVNHGFHNDTTPRYDEAAAELAWSRTLDWFQKHLASAA